MKIKQLYNLTEMAIKRRLSDEMSNERAMQLLQRRMKHIDSRTGSGGNLAELTAVQRVFKYNTNGVVKRMLDAHQMTPDQLAKFQNSWQFRSGASLAQGYVANPNDYYVAPSAGSNTDYPGVRYVWVGDKKQLAAKRLDKEDFDEFVDASEEYTRYGEDSRRVRGSLDRITKKYNDEQAALLAKQSAAAMANTPTANLPPPPSLVTLSPKNRDLNNPYYRGQQRWRGPPAQCPWAKNGMKMMMNVVIVALNKLGYPLIDLHHSINSNGEDQFYATDAKGMVKIYVIGTSTNEILIAINNKSYRLRRLYAANDIPQTTENLKNLFNYAGVTMP